ncbi:unnamed protein product [Clonostachys chloroleuca]|uniref:Uncharacterized protein n=1 Tax=Clonostachys chloroleuca TaxID=1926264 RepID=A0AA35M6U0_9HYPO|nr:unnamed protein product [Clonostachys chloroleuca]
MIGSKSSADLTSTLCRSSKDSSSTIIGTSTRCISDGTLLVRTEIRFSIWPYSCLGSASFPTLMTTSPIYGSDMKLLSAAGWRFHVSNISVLSKLAEDAREDARLWASQSEGDDTVDVDFPLDEDDDGEERATIAEHHQNFTTVLHTLQNAVRVSDATGGSIVLSNFVRDLLEEISAEEEKPFMQRPDSFYKQIRRAQDAPLCHVQTLSVEDVQAAVKA